MKKISLQLFNVQDVAEKLVMMVTSIGDNNIAAVKISALSKI